MVRNSSLPLVLLAALAAPLPAAELILSTEVEGVAAPVVAVDERPGLLAGPDRRPVPADATWHLALDTREHAAFLGWAPAYEIVRAEEPQRAATRGQPWRAKVQFEYIAPEASTEAAPGGWSADLTGGGAAVVAWVVDGKASQVVVRALPSTRVNRSVRFEAPFRLDDQEARDGQPVLLLWGEGGFVPPVPPRVGAADFDAFTATLRDDAPALERALAAGARPDAASPGGVPLIHHAARAGSARCVALLARRQPKVVAQTDPSSRTALQVAAANGRTSVVQALLAARARVSGGDPSGEPPLHLAARNGHADTVSVLLEAGAPAAPQRNDHNPLSAAIEMGHTDIADRLMAARARFDFQSERASRELLRQALSGNHGMLRWLVARGVDPNAAYKGTSVLVIAAGEGNADAARALVEAGAGVNRPTSTGFTPLMAAAEAGNAGIVALLLAAGADVNAATTTGARALHFAAIGDSAAIVESLLARGADIHARIGADATALDAALLNGSSNAAAALAARGARITLGTPSTERVLETAVRCDIVEPIEAALREGWPAESNFAGIWPATRVAEIFGSERCLAALLAAGAQPPNPDQPMAVARAAAVDEPLSVARLIDVTDPRGAREVFPEMVVRVGLLVDSEGRPLFARVNQTPDPRLGPAAIEGVLKARFNPPRQQGQPVAVRIVLPVRFEGSEGRSIPLERVTDKPRVIHRVAPVYPATLLAREITGRVVLGFTITREGKAVDFVVIESTHPGFVRPAIAAIERWRFDPGRVDGVPVTTTYANYVLEFALSD